MLKTALRIPVFAFFAALIWLAIGASGTLAAGEPRLISAHNSWNAYVFEEGGHKICFMSSQPHKSEGDYTKRGEVFAMITHRPGEKSRDVVSIIGGYPYKTGSDVKVVVAGKTFSLFTQDETAWASDTATDKALTQAIQKGSDMVVKGVSQRGTQTTDVFGLSGSGAAYKAISDSCGVK